MCEHTGTSVEMENGKVKCLDCKELIGTHSFVDTKATDVAIGDYLDLGPVDGIRKVTDIDTETWEQTTVIMTLDDGRKYYAWNTDVLLVRGMEFKASETQRIRVVRGHMLTRWTVARTYGENMARFHGRPNVKLWIGKDGLPIVTTWSNATERFTVHTY